MTHQHRRERADVCATAEPRRVLIRAVDRRHAHALAVLGVVVELRGRALPLRVELLTEGAPRRVVVDEHELVLEHEVVEVGVRERRGVVHAALDAAVRTAPDRDALFMVVHNDLVDARGGGTLAVRGEAHVAHVARDVDERLPHVVSHVDARERAGHGEQADVEVDAQPVLLVRVEGDARARGAHAERLVVREHERRRDHERAEREEAAARAGDLQLLRQLAGVWGGEGGREGGRSRPGPHTERKRKREREKGGVGRTGRSRDAPWRLW